MSRKKDAVLPRKRKSREKGTELAESESIPQFEPHCFLQCHDSGNDANNFKQQVWCCKFQPDSSDIVATCGGEKVCIIDANSAKVRGRFLKAGEEFYALDWTIMKTGAFSSNVLGCAGCLGFIYLIHTEQFCVYGFFKAHSKPVQTMLFVPGQPTLLLTAGNEKKIYLWDIGTLSLPDYHFSHRKLALFENLEFSPLKMLTLHDEYLLCASEGGLFCWRTDGGLQPGHVRSNPGKLQRFQDLTEIQFPFVEDQPLVDGLALVAEDLVATKCAQSGVIFLWNPSGALHKIKFESHSITAPICRELKWSNTEQFYINITSCQRQSILLAGDEKGSLWIYDCKTKENNAKSPKSCKGYLPGKPDSVSRLVQWPVCTRDGRNPFLPLDKGTVVNDICCSADLKYAVAVSDNNLVCIYNVK